MSNQGREFSHECEWCCKVVPCSRLDWEACEGRGDVWYCCGDCANELPVIPPDENEDDWRADR